MKSIALIGLMLAAIGCADRTHMTPGYGKSFHEFQARQMANPNAGDKDLASKGLDTQEAAMISHGYRASLAGKGQEVAKNPAFLDTSAQKSKSAVDNSAAER